MVETDLERSFRAFGEIVFRRQGRQGHGGTRGTKEKKKTEPRLARQRTPGQEADHQRNRNGHKRSQGVYFATFIARAGSP
jgi:hypothetical protein